MKKNVLLYCVLVAIAILMVGCRHRPRPDALNEKINSNCTIYFNRVALGGTSANIVPVITDETNGARVSMSGKLLKVTPEWVVIAVGNVADKKMLWVPRNVVLCISTE